LWAISYSVWYEHLAGLNQKLTLAIDSELAARQVLDQATIERLHVEHLKSRDLQHNEQLQIALDGLMARLTAAVAASFEGADEYAVALQKCAAELGAVNDPDTLRLALSSLIDATSAARNHAGQLRLQLKQSHSEMQSLRQRLGALQGEALIDPLTGLRNRRGFDAAFQQVIDQEGYESSGASLMLLDIDHFKQVNDTYGHLFGDLVIGAAGRILLNAIKGRDIVARFGGEEFLVFLPDTPVAGALVLAEQIRDAFSRARVKRAGSDKVLGQVTISIGVASPRSGESLDQAIERADQALYQAKHAGRNCVRLAAN
jgi:diguanylate cyclase